MHDLTGHDMVNVVRQALKDMQRESTEQSPWQQLALFWYVKRRKAFHNDRQVINQILRDGIERLKENFPVYASVLRLRFLDKLSVLQVVNQLHLGESTVYAHQRAAIDKLAEIVLMQEAQVQAEIQSRLASRLPLALYSRLIGAEESLEQLLAVVRTPGPPWLISIEGMGGIGKTSLADALLRRVARLGLFDDIGWVSTQLAQLKLDGEILHIDEAAHTPQQLVRQLMGKLMPEAVEPGGLTDVQARNLLQTRLHEVPHFIVIDNLETMADLEAVVPALQELADPTKFVLTTRESLYREQGVFSVPVHELSEEHALLLIRQEARLTNLPQVEAADDAELAPIYETVGGNPLALRLVAGQLHIHPLHVVLRALRAAYGKPAANLYTFIYRHAWDNLDDTCRQAFLSMALVGPDGDSLDYIAEISSVELGKLHTAIQTLVTLNLIDARGGLNDRRYSLHGLTRTFLLEQVAKWIG